MAAIRAMIAGMRACVLVLAACGSLPARPMPLPPLASAHSRIPLIDPLDGAELLVPVMIDGDGPYVFTIDPAAPHTIVAVAVIAQFVEPGQDSATVSLTVGELTTEVHDVQFAGASLDRGMRRIDGVLGRDALGATTVFGFDRDRGVAWLLPAQAFRPPPDSVAIALAPPQRDGVVRLDAAVDDAHHSFVLGLGARHSELHRALWKHQMTLPIGGVEVIDDFGNRVTATDAAVAGVVKTGDIARADMQFVDPQLARSAGDGVLGLDFFAPYDVEITARMLYLRARVEVTPFARISRWGELPCPDLGCVQLEQLATGELRVTRNRQTKDHDLEVTLATGTQPALIVDLPAGVDTLTRPLPVELAGKPLGVIDVSPFPRRCAGGGGCIDVL
jgi:hypothetical protein